MQAAVDSFDGETSPAAAIVREQYAAARKVAEDQHEPQAATKYDELRLRAIAAQRTALHRLRTGGEIGDELFAAFRRSWTGPNSMPRQPEAFNHLRVEVLSVGPTMRQARHRSGCNLEDAAELADVRCSFFG
jgi:hypothetical protein